MSGQVQVSDTDSFAERPVRSALSGCFYVTFVVLVSAGLLLVNALLCLTIYSAVPKPENSEDMVARVGQLFFFVAPVLLLIVEWNLLDRLNRLFRGRSVLKDSQSFHVNSDWKVRPNKRT